MSLTFTNFNPPSTALYPHILDAVYTGELRSTLKCMKSVPHCGHSEVWWLSWQEVIFSRFSLECLLHLISGMQNPHNIMFLCNPCYMCCGCVMAWRTHYNAEDYLHKILQNIILSNYHFSLKFISLFCKETKILDILFMLKSYDYEKMIKP